MIRTPPRQAMGLLTLSLCLTLPPFSADAGWFATPEQEAVRAFERGDYETAATGFSDWYRKGVAWYRAGRFKEANAAFSQSTRPEVLIDALYNQGNCYYQMKDYQQAIVQYERVLAMRPTHADARHNLTLARSHLQLFHCPLDQKLPVPEKESSPQKEPQTKQEQSKSTDQKNQKTNSAEKKQQDQKDKQVQKDNKDQKQDQQSKDQKDQKDQKKDQGQQSKDQKQDQGQQSKDQKQDQGQQSKDQKQDQGAAV